MSTPLIEQEAAAILASVNGLGVFESDTIGHKMALRAIEKALATLDDLAQKNAELVNQRDQLLAAISQGAKTAGMLRAEVLPSGPMAIQLAGDMGTELARLATVTQITPEQFDAAASQVAHALGDAYDCTRVWSAWCVGTMSEADFTQVAEQDDRVDEITRAALIGAGLSVPN